jgi:hypothetical protein
VLNIKFKGSFYGHHYCLIIYKPNAAKNVFTGLALLATGVLVESCAATFPLHRNSKEIKIPPNACYAGKRSI